MTPVRITMSAVAQRMTQRIRSGHAMNAEFLEGMASGLRCAGFPELADAIPDWEFLSGAELATVVNYWAGRTVFNSDLTLA